MSASDLQNACQVESDEGGSQFGDECWETDDQIYETVRIEQRKKDSTASQSSTDSRDSQEAAVDINLEEFNDVLNLYMRHQVSVTSFLHQEKNER